MKNRRMLGARGEHLAARAYRKPLLGQDDDGRSPSGVIRKRASCAGIRKRTAHFKGGAWAGKEGDRLAIRPSGSCRSYLEQQPQSTSRGFQRQRPDMASTLEKGARAIHGRRLRSRNKQIRK